MTDKEFLYHVASWIEQSAQDSNVLWHTTPGRLRLIAKMLPLTQTTKTLKEAEKHVREGEAKENRIKELGIELERVTKLWGDTASALTKIKEYVSRA